MSETITLNIDGDQWCALLGENIAEGLAGFGPTRAEAVQALALEIAEHEQTPLGHMLPPTPAGGAAPREPEPTHRCFTCGVTGDFTTVMRHGVTEKHAFGSAAFSAPDASPSTPAAPEAREEPDLSESFKVAGRKAAKILGLSEAREEPDPWAEWDGEYDGRESADAYLERFIGQALTSAQWAPHVSDKVRAALASLRRRCNPAPS